MRTRTWRVRRLRSRASRCGWCVLRSARVRLSVCPVVCPQRGGGGGGGWCVCRGARRRRPVTDESTTAAPPRWTNRRSSATCDAPRAAAAARQSTDPANRTLYIAWLGSRVVSVLDSGVVGPRFKSQSRRCRVKVLGKLFTPIVPLFTRQQNW